MQSVADAVPMVSIGMPVFNGERFIEKALDSILAQSYPHFELIISDNASTDRTGDICQRYAERDARIRYVRQSANKGASWNFRFVLDQSVGEYFMWAAADDWRYPNFINDAVSCFHEDPGLLCVQGTTDFMVGNRSVFKLKPISTFKQHAHVSFFLAREHYGKCMLMYGLFRRMHLQNADWRQLQGEEDWWWNDALFLYSLLNEGNLAFKRFPSVRYLLKSTKAERKNASVISKKRNALFSLISYHPLSYYSNYLSLTPQRTRKYIAIAVPLKMIKSILEACLFYVNKRRWS